MESNHTLSTLPQNGAAPHTQRPLVSVITPAYNEAAIIEENLGILSRYMEDLEDRYDWEIVVVNDGSKDNTGPIADEIARKDPRIRVIHHEVNRNLGMALKTGFSHSHGDYMVVMDLDLSYAPEHIERMLDTCIQTSADVVVASPYMKGGKTTKVPFIRLALSKVVNRFMRFASGKRHIHTYTGMVRAYKREFIQSLNIKATTYAVNSEIIQKAELLRARVIEIPAHLDWTLQVAKGNTRTSSIRIFKGILMGLMSGFIFRPYMFFMLVGMLLFLISLYMIVWVFINTFAVYPELPVAMTGFEERFAAAVAQVFAERPYSIIVGGITLIISLQFLGIGFLSLQNKRYFDELFHINTTLLKQANQTKS